MSDSNIYDWYKYFSNRPVELQRFTVEAFRNIRADNPEDRNYGVICIGALLLIDANHEQGQTIKRPPLAETTILKEKIACCARDDKDANVRQTAQKVQLNLNDPGKYLSNYPKELQRFSEEASSNIRSPNPKDRQYGVSCFGSLLVLDSKHEQGQTIKRPPETEPAKLKEKIDLCAAQDRDPHVRRTAQRVIYDLNQMRINPNRPGLPHNPGLAPRPQLRPL